MTILDEIFETKRRRVGELKRVTNFEDLVDAALVARRVSPRRSLRSALSDRQKPNIIAEFKRASPSRGVINDALQPADVARAYEAGGARAISVLTEEDHFRGSMDDLREVRNAISIPVLRKDFTFDEFQIAEAAAAGADAILLIVASLSMGELRRLRKFAEDRIGVDALVEVHTLDEMRVAGEIGATLIGVNNRDLRTFSVSLDTSRDLLEHAPGDAVLVAESGLKSAEDIRGLWKLGYSGFLIGETLMRSERPEEMLREFTSVS